MGRPHNKRDKREALARRKIEFVFSDSDQYIIKENNGEVLEIIGKKLPKKKSRSILEGILLASVLAIPLYLDGLFDFALPALIMALIIVIFFYYAFYLHPRRLSASFLKFNVNDKKIAFKSLGKPYRQVLINQDTSMQFIIKRPGGHGNTMYDIKCMISTNASTDQFFKEIAISKYRCDKLAFEFKRYFETFTEIREISIK